MPNAAMTKTAARINFFMKSVPPDNLFYVTQPTLPNRDGTRKLL
jgi:hypothetical protein